MGKVLDLDDLVEGNPEAKEELAELYSLLKRAQQHVPYLGETYRAIDDALAARGAK